MTRSVNMIYLRKITSLNNIKSNALGGQIATILILIMVLMIIFILVTLNIGNVSFRATKVANACDSAVLYLASMLATQAHYIYVALGYNYHYCVKGGYLGIVLAFIVALIMTILQQYWVWIVLAAAFAGAVGNYVATGTLKGAVQGAIMGAAIGLACYLGGPLLENPAIGGIFGITECTLTYWTIGAIALGAITTAAAVYNQSVTAKRVGENMATLSKQLSGLPEYEGTREGVLLNALNQVVDDPTITDPDKSVDCGKDPVVSVQGGDPLDLDGDGVYNEKVSCFDYWWYNHITDLKSSITSYKDLVTDFFENYLIPFYEHTLDFLPQMDRSEIECDCGSGAESPMTALFRAIANCQHSFFWLPGPDKSSLLDYYDCGDNCNTPAGWDDYDATHMHYENFIDDAKTLLKPNDCGYYKYDASGLSKGLRNRYNAGSDDNTDWFDELFDSRSTGDYYDIFAGIAGWMVDWKDSVIRIRDRLPGCQLAYNPNVTTTYKIKDATQPYCAVKYPPVYPCNWELERNDFSGPYFPNPVCKVYPGDKNTLNTEINTVRNFVNNLVPYAIAKYFSNPCPSPGPGVTCSLLGNVAINITRICLDGNIHNKCSNIHLGAGTATITYSGDYSFTCRCCHDECTTVTNPDGTTTTTCVSVCSDSFISNSGTGSDQIAAPDLDIPCRDVNSFLNILGTFSPYITGLPDNFATIDEDNTDEFQTVLDKFQPEIDSINTFLSGTQQMYNDLSSMVDNRATDGAGSVVYKWDDTEGEHSVKVESGAFKFPYTKKSYHGNFLVNKKCVDLKIPQAQTWIQITRTDPGEKILNSSAIDLGLKWNPFQGPMVIKRKSTASYNAKSVGIGSIK